MTTEQLMQDMPSSVFLYSGDTLLLENNVLSGITLNIADGDFLLLKAGGVASSITVSQDCLIELENDSCADDVHLLSEGTCIVNEGASLNFLTIDNGGLCSLYGDLETADVSGALYLHGNASLSTALVNAEGLLSLWGEDCMADDIIVSGTASVYHGTLSNAYATENGRIRLATGTHADNMTICDGGSIDISTGAVVNNLTAFENAFVRVAKDATMTGTVCLATPLTLSGKIYAASADFILMSDSLLSHTSPLIPDWSLCTPRSLSISISEKLLPGDYQLIDNLDTPIVIPILDEYGAELGKCSPSKRLGYDDFILSLELIDGSLSFHSEYCTFTQINSEITLRTDNKGFAIFSDKDTTNLVKSWNKITEQLENEHITYLSPESSECNASSLEIPSVFFANPAGHWGNDYLACNVITGEFMSMEGMNRFDGVFIGSAMPSLLMLTNEADAIFADDIFTAFPHAAEEQRRLSMLSEIRACDGDDLIDMTCEHFTDSNENITIRGGDGDDVIWGANDGSRLFGDLGDDILSGGIGNDILCGGAGDDILRGFGGFDIYAFGIDSGNDTILLDDGDFILWFDYGIAISENDIIFEDNTAVISFGSLSSVTLTNLPDDKLAERLVFGDDARFADVTYTSLACMGAFDSDSSTRIFNAIA